jgi:hypothetical protein
VLRRLRSRPGEAAASGRPPLGTVQTRLTAAGLAERLAELGEGGELAAELDRSVEEGMGGLVSLSALTSSLAVTYLERIKHALKQLSLEAGVVVTTRGYVAHLVVESDPSAYGAAGVPVLGTLPPARHGRPPQDLLTRVVKATRRGFEAIRAVDEGTWDGFVACTTYRVHERGGSALDEAGDAGFVDPLVIDGLVRFGWVLRQADIHYGMRPERE